MMVDKNYEVIIAGGSYAGLSAAMSFGRSLRSTLVIDNGKPCNAPTPHSHNFLTQDGKAPTMHYALLLSNLTGDLTILTNGQPGFSHEQLTKLRAVLTNVLNALSESHSHNVTRGFNFCHPNLFASFAKSRVARLYS